MRTPTPGGDPLGERLGGVERRLAELERRANRHGTMLDAEGNIIAAADATTGVGLGLPLIPFGWASARPGLYDFFWASGETVPGVDVVWKAVLYKQHPMLQFAVETFAPTGEAGALRLLIAGTQAAADVPFPAGASRYMFGPLPIPGQHLAPVELRLAMWRTAGTGLVRCWPQDSYGVPL